MRFVFGKDKGKNMEHTELALTGYIVVAWRSVDPIDKDMAVLYFENAQDLDAWLETGNMAYKTTAVAHLLPEIFMKCAKTNHG